MRNAAASPRLAIGAARVVLVVVLIAYVRWLWPSMGAYAGGADSVGYLWSARLFSEGRLSAPIQRPRAFPESIPASAFAPLGTTTRPGEWALVPTYPTGFPLHIAAFRTVLPEAIAIRLVMAVLTAGTLWLTYRLGRACGLARGWAVLPPAVLGLSPLFLFLAVQPLSDIGATFWALAVVLSAWAARRTSRCAIVAGAALGMATLVRPTNVVLVFPLLAALPWTRDRFTRLVAAGAPFGLFLAAYQWWCYGAPWRSGYGDVGSAFALATAPKTVQHYVTWLPVLCSWLILLAPLALFVWRGALARWRLVLPAWTFAIFGVYAFYYHTAETWWYLRFVAPGLPPLIVGGAVVLQALVNRIASGLPRTVANGLTALALIAIFGGLLGRLVTHPLFEQHRDVAAGERMYADVVRWMTRHGERAHPIVLSQLGGAALYYGPGVYQLRLDRVSAADWQALRDWQRRTGLPVDAALLPFESDDLFVKGRERLACAWEGFDSYRSVAFWRCPPPPATR